MGVGMRWDGTRISGTGPEKFFPVMRARVIMSIASNYVLKQNQKNHIPTGMLLLRQWSILA